MPDLEDGASVEIQGSARTPYILRNTGGVYSCTCPAWRNQSIGIERRTCKHLRKYRGEAAEQERIGQALPARPEPKVNEDGSTAPPLLLAESWQNDVDLSGWWMSEKLDGVRAWWDGKQILSRQGNLYHAPYWFLEALPDTPLDGELWLDRKAFQRTVSIVRRQDKSEHWRAISFLVFDAPAMKAPFEERMEFLREHLADSSVSHLKLHTHERCRDVAHLQEELARVEALGGEGLMLREPGSLYVAGRSSTLLKVKSFHEGDARVLDHQAGAGRHKGRLGALLVELPDGTQFSIGTGFSDREREQPPAVGSVVTFRYQELSDRGVPRFPSFVRERRDIAASAGSAARTDASHVARSVRTADPTPLSSAALRHFEFVEGTSQKFWEIQVADTDVQVRYGKIGSQGQTQTKSFADSAAAQRHAEKLILEKTGKGYVERSL